MRVTDQIMNATARKAGVPVNMSLVDYLNKSQKNSFEDVFGTSSAADLTKKKEYEKLEKTAEELAKSAQAFLAEGQDSMFAKAKESGDMEEIYSHVEKLLENYNDALKSLKSSSSPLDDYYRQMLGSAAGEQSEALKTAGITIGKDGTLSLDKEKLKETDLDSLEKLFGSSGSFSEKVAFLGERIADNAGANALSYSSKYNSKGNSYAALGNKYDIWG
ncbi:MAG: hypothetical protein HFH49_04970 [Lachnospiraceae bacterium]|nr:hypothetical protein [Lachnospiraceae bacterium]